MAIPEKQLETWTGLGSVQQSSATYQSIKGMLDDTDAPYASRNIDSFLQGSYCNDTNIYGDSDVDIVLRTKMLFTTISTLCRSRRRRPSSATIRLHPSTISVLSNKTPSLG